LFLATGCATGPRVTEILHNTRLTKVGKFDQGYFVTDRVSGLPLDAEELPADQQGEYFYVSWSPATIESVKFEYRQVKLPNKISIQTLTAVIGQRSATFPVVGDEFNQGGAVSTWRISLMKGDQVVATKQSALW
jgi:hypothetical protein